MSHGRAELMIADRAEDERRSAQGHGRRLTAAFEAMEAFPALAESRDRLAALADADALTAADVAGVVEGDVALVIAVLRRANQLRPGTVTVTDAVEVLTPDGVQELGLETETFDFFERTPAWDSAPERFRLHALATQRVAIRVLRDSDVQVGRELMVAALLHDIGKLVLGHAYPGYPRQIHGSARTPEHRVHAERRELGVDHALVGGVLARRWGFPDSLASAIERHHADDAEGVPAVIRLADMIAHYSHGRAISPNKLLLMTRRIGLKTGSLRSVLYDIPFAAGGRGGRLAEPCPLSTREVQVLKRLANGMVYKQIASELDLSTSTVRTHLHNIYGKVGAVDRAQAVLLASERGWID